MQEFKRFSDLEAFQTWGFLGQNFYLSLGTQLSTAPAALACLGLAPPRVEAFCSLAIVGKISTVDKLRRRGLTPANFSDICVMCQKEEETINHLILHCEVVANIWSHFIARCGVAWCCPESIVHTAQS